MQERLEWLDVQNAHGHQDTSTNECENDWSDHIEVWRWSKRQLRYWGVIAPVGGRGELQPRETTKMGLREEKKQTLWPPGFLNKLMQERLKWPYRASRWKRDTVRSPGYLKQINARTTGVPGRGENEKRGAAAGPKSQQRSCALDYCT